MFHCILFLLPSFIYLSAFPQTIKQLLEDIVTIHSQMFSIFPRNEAILTCNYHRASLWLRQERIHVQCRDLCSILGLGGSHGEGIGYPLQYSCLENSMDRGAWWATVHGVAKSHDLVTKHSRNSTGKNTGESFAQWQYRSQ